MEERHPTARRARRYRPMLATPAPEPPAGRGWLYEVEWGGCRTIARVADGQARLRDSRGRDLTARFDAVARRLGRALRSAGAVVDGEVCALDRRGRPDVELLEGGKGRLVYVVFDLLELDGEPLLDRPLAERRELLARTLARDRTILLSEAFDDGRGLLEAAREQGLAGVVAKRARSRYRPGARSPDWLTLIARVRRRFAVVGYVPVEGRHPRVESLVVACEPDGPLVYAGTVDAAPGEDLLACLEPLRRETPPLAETPTDAPAGAVWTEPRLVAEVEVAGRTDDDGRADARILVGLHERERPAELEVARGRRRVRLTRLDRLLWRDERIDRGTLVEYYRTVVSVLLPHLRDRPFTMRRYFTVVGGPCEWVKDAPPEMPDWIPVAPLPARSRGGAVVRYPLVNDELALLWMLEYGCVDLHVWPSRADRPDRPDYVLFDLDPSPGTSFADVVRAAQLVREALDSVGLDSVPRTSGGEGLHVLVPIERRSTHDEARLFARAVAGALARTHPELVTTQPARAARRGVYVDAKMNGHGQQIVATYSVRPRAGAPVATPLRWDEVAADLDPSALTMQAVLARVERDGDLAAPLLGPRQRLGPALRRIGA